MRWHSWAIVAVLATSVSGCGSIGERSLAGAFNSPGQYDVFTCQDIENYTGSYLKKKDELEQLMSRASQNAGGDFVNIIAYRGEYAQNRGRLADLAKAKEDKQCAVNSKFSSGRSVF